MNFTLYPRGTCTGAGGLAHCLRGAIGASVSSLSFISDGLITLGHTERWVTQPTGLLRTIYCFVFVTAMRRTDFACKITFLSVYL